MAIVQNNFPANQPVAYAGMVSNGETSNRISRTVEDSAGIGFGKAVFRGTGNDGCTATPSAAFLGITIAHEALGLLPGGTADLYPQYASAAIMTMGEIWVVAGANVTADAQVYVTSGGVFTSASSGNTILTGWEFDTAASSGSFVQIVKR